MWRHLPHQLRNLRVTQHDHVRFTVEPRTSVRGRSRARVELWRKLHAEWRGSAPQVIPAKAMKYQDLHAAVGSTAILGAVGVSGLDGRVCHTCVGQAQGLDKPVPQEQLTVIASRPQLAVFWLKLLWVGGGGGVKHRWIVPTSPKGLCSHCTPVGSRFRCPHGKGDARRFQSIGERSRAIVVVAPPSILRYACGWW